ncbi:MAG: hypothetical protein AABZ74_16565 [Cyanobacteriota bacterium]
MLAIKMIISIFCGVAVIFAENQSRGIKLRIYFLVAIYIVFLLAVPIFNWVL